MRRGQLLNCRGMNSSRRMAASTERREVWPTFVVQDGLGHDGARGISRAQKQNVVMFRHKGCPHPQQVGAQQEAAGFTARMKPLKNLPSISAGANFTGICWPDRNSSASSAR